METSPLNESAVIEMSGVSVASVADPERAVLENVDWTVHAGDYWVVAGMQRSGKTDLLYTTAGLLTPLVGSYKLFGCDMPIYDPKQFQHRLRLALVFDSGQLLHQLNVHENIALPARYHRDLSWKELEERVKEILEWTGISQLAQFRPSSLSNDARKRAGLARALMLEPEILLFDNPLVGSDLRQAKWWLNIIDRLSAGHEILGGRRVTVVVTANDLRPWRNRPCHIAVLQNNRFLSLGRGPKFQDINEPLVDELFAGAVQD